VFNDADPRKVFPQYGEGPLVKVGWARNQAEAELIAGLLLEEGIPSVAKRSGGFDVPDFLAAGPRDIFGAYAPSEPTPRAPLPAWVRAVALTLVAVTVALVAAGVIRAFV
jgi:hypothetical protein